MTESDEDLFSRNVFRYPNESTTFSVKGPNVNMTNMNIRNSQHNPGLQPNFNRQRSAKSCIDQRSYRREISPISIYSAVEIPRNYSHQNGLNFQMFSGRGVSPVSVRSRESTISACLKKIALAFREAEIDMSYKNYQFNSNELKLIQDAYQKFMKKNMRRKISKKKDQVTSGRHYKVNSQDLSEDLTSDSSSSSSEDKSQRKGLKNNNYNTLSCRSTKSNFTLPKSNMRVNNTFRANSGNIEADVFGNISSIQQVNVQLAQNRQNIPIMPKNRFKKGYALPSQRFNRSTIQESNENVLHNNESNQSGHKRNHDDEDINVPQKKKQKISPNPKILNIPNTKENGFNFVIPKFPVRKSATTRKSGAEIISSTVLHPSTSTIEDSPKTISDKEAQRLKDNETNSDLLNENNIGDNNKNTSDVSMRPSFIKRKLFTQRLEVTEKQNLSTDSVQSPQTGHSVRQKDKTKPRKLTTTQSCLTRDLDKEDNNLYNLISKIVPAEHINKQDTVIKKPVVNGRNKENISNGQSKNSKSNNDATKKTALTTFKSFWDTDLETDSEFTPKKNFGVTQKELAVNRGSAIKNRPVFTLHKDSSERLGNIFIFNGNTETPAQESDKISNSANDLQNMHNLRVRIKRLSKNSCCDDAVTSKLEANKELVSKNKDKHQNNTGELTSTGDMPKNQNKKTSISNKLTRHTSSVEAGGKITARFNKEQKNRTTSKSKVIKNTDNKFPVSKNGTLVTDPKNKGSNRNRILLTPKKNASKKSNNKLNQSTLSDQLDLSKCLRSRIVNLSHDSLTINTTKKVTPIKKNQNNMQGSIKSFCVKNYSNQNGKSTMNFIRNKANTSDNKMLLNTTVQTRRSKALNTSKDMSILK
ncbi:hypothetical protein K1T71_010219 [Dendrolimus kikuchii]|uniref:Uncharacterized protein n=1 Tax=Dendrolimus kikuchii TaxID=765133 RepID=A0ACC1CR90_9NEOP|nr:hypothetical protein K1T71_010219 [Dendrolimus kikuchii]